MTGYPFAFKPVSTVAMLSFMSNMTSFLKKLSLRDAGSIEESIHPSKEIVAPNLCHQKNEPGDHSGRSGKATYTSKEGIKLEI